MWNRMSLQAKLISSMVLLAFLVAGLGFTSLRSLEEFDQRFDYIADTTIPNLTYVAKLDATAAEVARLTLRAYVSLQASKDSTKFLKDLAKQLEVFEETKRAYKNMLLAPGEKEKIDRLDQAWVSYARDSKRAAELISNASKRQVADADELEKLVYERLPEARRQFLPAVNDLFAFQIELKNKLVSEASSIAHAGKQSIYVGTALGFVGAIALGLFLSLTLSRALRALAETISTSADHTASASAQLSASSEQLSSGATEAASSLEETVASLEELSSMVSRNANAATEANSLSQRSRDSAAQGEKEIAKLIEAMSDLARGSKKIEEITNVIDDIAFQTNLLALNAAVEAARAGEQGKGFAVVAEAVRTLAQRSGEAAKEINSLIKENVAKSENGSVIAGQSGQVLRDIVTSVMKVADLNNEIATASQEQSTGINQISKAMNQLDQATQVNAASSEEVAASAQDLSGQSQGLQKAVRELQLLVEGSGPSYREMSRETASRGGERQSGSASRSRLLLVKNGKSGSSSRESRAKSTASQAIPFDDADEGQVGNVRGF